MSLALFLTGLAVVAVFVAIVRLAPHDAARWHVGPFTAEDPGEGGVRIVRRLEGDPETVLARLDAVALAEPRTERLAGSPAEGRITWVTRTRGVGFPDYTTVAARKNGDGCELAVLARLRFGKSDLGVNRERVERWLEGL